MLAKIFSMENFRSTNVAYAVARRRKTILGLSISNSEKARKKMKRKSPAEITFTINMMMWKG